MAGLKVHTRESVRKLRPSNMDAAKRDERTRIAMQRWARNCGGRSLLYAGLPGNWAIKKPEEGAPKKEYDPFRRRADETK